MTHPVARLGMNLLLCSMAVPAIAAQSEQTPRPSAVPPPPAATHAPFAIIQQGSLATGGSSGTVITGRKGYAVETTVSAKVL